MTAEQIFKQIREIHINFLMCTYNVSEDLASRIATRKAVKETWQTFLEQDK